ncbi:transcriptional regulator [Jannaschia faecimaris]|uniref:Transcriptional regulator n=1 Tax=Jannaschia faecimaris TaxID=1244108 RepID=A0A1H3SUE0_9RHOB|nr:sugar-binding domain-containing protein [Jannaschia faecimaris]SDZ41141.1 transcriptional regulator [Jannaschia faecimaris]
MDDDIRIRAAWLYHVGGLSQGEVGQRLGLSRFKVLRLLSDAKAAGEVIVTLDHRSVGTLALAEALRVRFGLRDALIAPDDGTDASASRQAVGMVAARWFSRVAATGPMTVGVGWGRTLSAMADALTGLNNPDLRVVSLMGAMVRTGPEGPIDVCARIAAVAGGQALFLPAPFLADTVEDAAVLMRQRLVREALEAARGARHMIVSVGEGGRDALLTSSGVLNDADLAALERAGVVADTTGKFLRADGTLAPVDLNDRTPAIGLDDLKRAEVTLLAAGVAKAAAARAVLRAGFVDRIVADETLARILMEDGT